MENELEEILISEEKLQILITRIEHCLCTPKIHVDRNSLRSSNSSPIPRKQKCKSQITQTGNFQV